MKKLLFIKASPRGESSDAIAITNAYIDARLRNSSDLIVDAIDLWLEDLPPFDGDRANAKLAVITGQEQSMSQKTAWDRITEIAQRFASADHYVFAIPMWNGGIPYRLKHYIDIIHQPGLTFLLDPNTGYSGLLKSKKATMDLHERRIRPSVPDSSIRCGPSVDVYEELAESGGRHGYRGDSLPTDPADGGSNLGLQPRD